ncbi:hypothetical protein [Moraxella boevrei]|uniref:hypothetical protein n=1 Tax=Faucicola boevrei TaxID=346665 RepID=UPI0037351638
MITRDQFFKEYQSSDEDDKYESLSYFYYHSGLVVDEEIFEFLNKELGRVEHFFMETLIQ